MCDQPTFRHTLMISVHVNAGDCCCCGLDTVFPCGRAACAGEGFERLEKAVYSGGDEHKPVYLAFKRASEADGDSDAWSADNIKVRLQPPPSLDSTRRLFRWGRCPSPCVSINQSAAWRHGRVLYPHLALFRTFTKSMLCHMCAGEGPRGREGCAGPVDGGRGGGLRRGDAHAVS